MQTLSESIFGDIAQLEVTKQNFIILDKTTHSILIFSKDGGFQAKISGKRTGNFSYNEMAGEIGFQDFDSATDYLYYNLEGKFIRKEVRKFLFYDIAFLNEEIRAFYRNSYYSKLDESWFPTSNLRFSNLLIEREQRDIEGAFLSFDTTALNYNECYTTQKNFYKINNDYYFIQPYNYNIYKVKEDEIASIFQFSFPKQNSLPNDFLTNRNFKSKRLKFLMDNPQVYYSIDNFSFVNNKLFFNLLTTNSTNIFFYDLAERELHSFNNILSAENSFFLPIGERLNASYGESIFCSVSAAYLFEAKKLVEMKNKGKKFPSTLTKFFENFNPKSNPIVIQLFLKS